MDNGNNIKSITIIAVCIILGIAILIAGVMEYVDPTLSGFGGAFIGVALAKLWKIWKIKSNPEYAKQLEIANRDERNLFVAQKAHSLSFAGMIAILTVAGVILLILGHKDYGMLCFWGVSIQTLLYLCSYLYFQKKY